MGILSKIKSLFLPEVDVQDLPLHELFKLASRYPSDRLSRMAMDEIHRRYVELSESKEKLSRN